MKLLQTPIKNHRHSCLNKSTKSSGNFYLRKTTAKTQQMEYLIFLPQLQDIPTKDIVSYELTDDSIVFDRIYIEHPDKSTLIPPLVQSLHQKSSRNRVLI